MQNEDHERELIMRRGFSALTVNDANLDQPRYDDSGNSITDSMYDPEVLDDAAHNDTVLSIDLDQVECWYDEVKQGYND